MPTLLRDPWLPPELENLPQRTGQPPRLSVNLPCEQIEQASPPAVLSTLLNRLRQLPAITVTPYDHSRYPEGTIALSLPEELARGQPEAFLDGTIFALVRPDGSIELRLKPEWGEVVLQARWGTIHPLARYLSGIVPPQSLIIFAPRNEEEIEVVIRIVQSAAWYAQGRVYDTPLPDSRW